MGYPSFEIKRSSKNNEFYFNLKAKNGQVILSSEGYKTESSCLNGIESVRTNSGNDDRYQRKETLAGFSFNLKSSNGQVVGTSEVYTTRAARENGIESVKTNAPIADIVDLS